MEQQIRPTILVVDDSKLNRSFLSNVLKRDYQVLFAEDGLAGLAMARGEEPALILLDIVMPGIDGIETCRRLKADPATATIPVIFITGKNDPLSTKQGFEVGAVDYITKPFYPVEALARIKTHLALQSAQQTLATQNRLLMATIHEQELSIELARRILNCINPAPQRYIELSGERVLFAAAYSIPCRVEGGDHHFIRTIETPRGRKTLFTLKDQSGHAVNCILRSIFTDLVHNAIVQDGELSLDETMERLNDAVSQAGLFEHDDFFTALAGEIDHHTLLLRYVAAGHPPLILIRDSRTVSLPGHDGQGSNLPMGIMPGITFQAGQHQLQSGDMLFCYTDGLTEMPQKKKGKVLDSDELRALLKKILKTTPTPCINDLMEKTLAAVTAKCGETVTLTQDNTSEDDVTLLGLEIEDSLGCHSQTLIPAAFIDTDTMLRCFTAPIQEHLALHGYAALEFKVHMVLSEAIINAWKHGNRQDLTVPIEVRWRFGNDLTLEVIDQGRGFDFSLLPDPTDPRNILAQSGRGLFIIQKLADSVEWRNNGSHLRLRFYRKNTDAGASPSAPPFFSLWELPR